MEMPELKRAMPVGYAWDICTSWLIVCANCRPKVGRLGNPQADLYETKGDAQCDLCGQYLD